MCHCWVIKRFFSRAEANAEARADAQTEAAAEYEAEAEAAVWRSLDTHKAWLVELPVGQLIT